MIRIVADFQMICLVVMKFLKGGDNIPKDELKQAEKFESLRIDKKIITIGSFPTQDGNPAMWAAQEIKAPRPISFSLIPIYKLKGFLH